MRTSERQLFRARFAWLCRWLRSDVCGGVHRNSYVCPHFPFSFLFFFWGGGDLFLSFFFSSFLFFDLFFSSLLFLFCSSLFAGPPSAGPPSRTGLRPMLIKIVLTNTTKIPREDHPEREERMKFPAGGRKKSEILGGPAEGHPPKILNTQHTQHTQLKTPNTTHTTHIHTHNLGQNTKR